MVRIFLDQLSLQPRPTSTRISLLSHISIHSIKTMVNFSKTWTIGQKPGCTLIPPSNSTAIHEQWLQRSSGSWHGVLTDPAVHLKSVESGKKIACSYVCAQNWEYFEGDKCSPVRASGSFFCALSMQKSINSERRIIEGGVQKFKKGQVFFNHQGTFKEAIWPSSKLHLFNPKFCQELNGGNHFS